MAMRVILRIDGNIVLKTADRKDKIVAQVFSTASALDAISMMRWQTLAFVFHWWWVAFMTNPRILHEARILWSRNCRSTIDPR